MNLLVLHSHPDDEAMLTGGILLRASATKASVAVFFATRGELGDRFEQPELSNCELGCVREAEAKQALRMLNVTNYVFLGYKDSGYKESAGKNELSSLCKQDPSEISNMISRALPAPVDLIITYDINGTYGHPDHIFMSSVGELVADEFPAACLLHTSFNREFILASGLSECPFVQYVAKRPHLGLPKECFSVCLDIRPYIKSKYQALSCHRSQCKPGSLVQSMLSCDEKQFSMLFGTEWFIVKRGGKMWSYIKARLGFLDSSLL